MTGTPTDRPPLDPPSGDSPGRRLTIVRDRWGIAHARANSADDAFWVQGWLAAADRLWQMEWDRRRGLGRWAEVAGPGAVAEDRLFRRLDLASVARAHHEALGPDTKAMTRAYAEGVNRWLADHANALPPEFAHHPEAPEPWEPWHCLLVYKIRHLFMGTLHRKLWRAAVALRVGPDLVRAMVGDRAMATPIVADGVDRPDGSGPDARLDLVAGGAEVSEDALSWLSAAEARWGIETDGGSNSWALDGSRTASGKPLLAGDPHRGIEFPNVYHQCHIACDDFDAIGLAFPGVPGFPHFGHNEAVAWCITHGMADDTDVFVETDPVEVTRTETIAVLDGPDVEVACGRTERGPVIFGEPGTPAATLTMAWTGMTGPDSTFDCLAPMLTAGSVDELERAVGDWVLPVNSLLSADTAGSISFRIRGRLVERPPVSRWVPVPGDAGHGWDGRPTVPDDRLPRWRNPERGYLVTANNLVARSGPYISLDFASSARHDRIVELLDPLTAATAEDMRTIHGDVTSLAAPAHCAFFAPAEPESALGREAMAVLAGWDHRLTEDSAGAVVYHALRSAWADEVGRRLSIDRPDAAADAWASPVWASRLLFGAASTLARTGWPPGTGLDGADEPASLGALVDRATATVAEQLGSDPAAWRWDAVHTMVCPHPLASARPDLADLHPPADACGGDGDTVRAASVSPLTGLRVAAGSVARYAFDLADWDRSAWVVPHGVSGVRGGGHDLDQREAWLACELLPMAYTPAAIDEVAEASIVLDL